MTKNPEKRNLEAKHFFVAAVHHQPTQSLRGRQFHSSRGTVWEQLERTDSFRIAPFPFYSTLLPSDRETLQVPHLTALRLD